MEQGSDRAGANARSQEITSAYVHIPFCRRRCYYCDFPVSILGDRSRGDDSGAIAQYLDYLEREITLSPSLTSPQPLKTVFFGGGTPSLLSARQVDRVITALDRRFGVAGTCEISMEMDPGTFDFEQVRGYVEAGVTRVSLGGQAFQDDLLQRCGRTHRTGDILAAVEMLRRGRVANLSLDLISGLPEQTLTQWRESLEAAIALSPEHLSCYDLVLEPVTAFGKQFQPGEKPLPSDETAAQMYRLARERLALAGYEHYEISNYARAGFQCRHNRVYWENRPYYGFGMGAASYVAGRRFTRDRTRREYFAWVEAGYVADSPPTSARDRLCETLMLGLRLAEGVSLTEAIACFGEEVLEAIVASLQPYRELGWVEMKGDRLCLSDPEGFLFSNAVLAEVFRVADAIAV
ncbi:MAG: radical SAM family heme chaperone HemW [Cyanobacteriota bacterium]|nr:radical SAM family heme chaperone HemW [Cyanobacteriota bacterium]